ncbi:fimbrial protein [Serratia marcescens]|uniref:fimbrial protein n=1 Tax=Serratia TaxID=613 RepID=UPI0011F1C76C|nr:MULTISPECIES: fimbrial protein [Serratia]ELQ9308140.1 fimbrial protein [Serratia marcescens]ELQ9437925.1 fimbrial protein [Serratia marcescens]ELT5558262.1 fimbrial protein [Serratia marcescens]MBH2581963.1 fimbrial protein [Serratia marcescens]MBH2729956.1 fimbrial protein [Serratia marcescens]
MSSLLKHKNLGLAAGLLVTLGAFSQSSYALSCKQNGSIRQDIVLDKAIKVSTANTAPGALLWRSQTFTSTFQCTDDWNNPKGENAYLYWDPQSRMSQIHNSIEVGVTYQGIDVKPTKGARQDVGPGTECRRSGSRCLSPARPLTVTVSYAIYIKATGKAPPAGGKINDNNSYSVFQVDGVGGLNGTPNSNFNAYISGLGNIQFISCNPKITVVANNGSTVNFGTIPRQNAVVGKIEKQVPFSVAANMSDPTTGQDCQGETLQASFSSTYPLQDNSVILPTSDSGFGILISQAATPNTPIMMNSPVDLGLVNGTIVEKNFMASLKWLSTNPKVGPFSASANIDVTFK